MLLKLFVQPCQGRAAIIPDQFLMTGLLQKRWVAFTRSWEKEKKKKAEFLFNNTQLYSCQNIFFLDLNNHTFNLTMQTNFSFHLDFAFYMYLFLSYKLHASLVLLQVFSQLFCPEAKGFLQVLYQPVSSSKPVAVLPSFFNPSELSEKLKQ